MKIICCYIYFFFCFKKKILVIFYLVASSDRNSKVGASGLDFKSSAQKLSSYGNELSHYHISLLGGN